MTKVMGSTSFKIQKLFIIINITFSFDRHFPLIDTKNILREFCIYIFFNQFIIWVVGTLATIDGNLKIYCSIICQTINVSVI